MPPQHEHLSTELHSVIFQKTVIAVFNMRTTSLTTYLYYVCMEHIRAISKYSQTKFSTIN
jgi:hypothetical protein